MKLLKKSVIQIPNNKVRIIINEKGIHVCYQTTCKTEARMLIGLVNYKQQIRRRANATSRPPAQGTGSNGAAAQGQAELSQEAQASA